MQLFDEKQRQLVIKHELEQDLELRIFRGISTILMILSMLFY